MGDISKASEYGLGWRRFGGPIEIFAPTQNEIAFGLDHSGRVLPLCELDRSPRREDGIVDLDRTGSFQGVGTGNEDFERLRRGCMRQVEIFARDVNVSPMRNEIVLERLLIFEEEAPWCGGCV